MLFELWSDVLPNALSVRIGHNTEGYILALVIAAWIQFVRPRIAGSRAEWIITAIAALAFVGLTIYLLAGHGVASRFKTLNEGTLAAALLIPYVQLRRPLPRLVAAVAALVIVAVTIVTNKSAETTDMAETFGMIILGIVGLDVVDRGILDPAAKTSPMLAMVLVRPADRRAGHLLAGRIPLGRRHHGRSRHDRPLPRTHHRGVHLRAVRRGVLRRRARPDR